MNGVHDLGGMHGFGPIQREENEPLFHAAWEARVFGIMRVARAQQEYFTLDAMRHGIERMPPAEYLRSSYYERWLASVEYNMSEQGLIDGDELEARVASLREHSGADPPRAREVAVLPQAREAPPKSSPPMPRFAVGDVIMTRNVHPVGHTRLPRYARGKRGVIHRAYGPQTFPDTNAHGLGEQPQPLYSVRFVGSELWGDSAEPGQVVYLDLWDSYLDPAPA
ncbi:MAG: nitrile hydratase subunit beta [Chloroflexota bacterium]|nr:nitrile hydratase subunit beta [Chloroflexota bacterium]